MLTLPWEKKRADSLSLVLTCFYCVLAWFLGAKRAQNCAKRARNPAIPAQKKKVLEMTCKMHVFDWGCFAQGRMSRDSLQTGLDLLRLNTTASMEPPGDIKAQIQASMVDVYCVNVHFCFCNCARRRWNVFVLCNNSFTRSPPDQCRRMLKLLHQEWWTVLFMFMGHRFFSQNISGHKYFSDADPGQHAPGHTQVPISFLCVILCMYCIHPLWSILRRLVLETFPVVPEIGRQMWSHRLLLLKHSLIRRCQSWYMMVHRFVFLHYKWSFWVVASLCRISVFAFVRTHCLLRN